MLKFINKIWITCEVFSHMSHNCYILSVSLIVHHFGIISHLEIIRSIKCEPFSTINLMKRNTVNVLNLWCLSLNKLYVLKCCIQDRSSSVKNDLINIKRRKLVILSFDVIKLSCMLYYQFTRQYKFMFILHLEIFFTVQKT